MRYHWGLGVGHFHAHGLASTSSWTSNQSRDTDAPDNSSTNPDPTSDFESHVTDFDNEMTLDERDLEGWEDVESDTSEAGCGQGDDDLEDDFGEMYE
jgi:hypothetical protein